jgi:hypothetical protein
MARLQNYKGFLVLDARKHLAFCAKKLPDTSVMTNVLKYNDE